jgi:hypothetical protein
LVLYLGLTPDYVLDKMQMYEVKTLLKNSHYKNKDSWEQARMNSYIVAQVNSTKSIKPTDIMSFPWEKEVKDNFVSADDRVRLTEMAKQWETKIKS